MSNRVWIYASLTPFSDEVESSIHNELDLFLKEWKAHGITLSASSEILFHHLIVIKADEAEAMASGCSIDKQVQLMKELGKNYNLDFFNRLLIAYEKEGGFFIFPSAQTKSLLEKGDILADTLVFDLSVSTEEQFKNNFRIPLKDSWLSKYLNQLA
ncbi:MAG: ABC transporter ATPase [Bacteroidota bacterium]|jgi:hypothetical protein